MTHAHDLVLPDAEWDLGTCSLFEGGDGPGGGREWSHQIEFEHLFTRAFIIFAGSCSILS